MLTPQSIAVGFTVAAVCAVAAFIMLMRQAANHADDRAALLREHLDTLRALHVPVQEQEPEDERPGPDWWDRQFDGITSGLGDDEGEGL